jgi:hypothetical protein
VVNWPSLRSSIRDFMNGDSLLERGGTGRRQAAGGPVTFITEITDCFRPAFY